MLVCDTPHTRLGEITITGTDIEVVPVEYGHGVKRAIQVRTLPLKTQANRSLRINHIRVPGHVIARVLECLSSPGAVPQPLIPNYAPLPIIQGHRVVSYHHVLTDEVFFCSCAKHVHKDMLERARARAHQYASNSWPHMVMKLLGEASYLEEICHLCVARQDSVSEMESKFGIGVQHHFDAFIDQIAFDMQLDQRTARLEAMHVLGQSRWVRESTLYGVVRELFPNHTVQREASPEWLGRMRLDIYLPDLGLAVEHQGEQHYRPLNVFGGAVGHARVVERDALKRSLCEQNGVTVIDVRYDAPISKAAIRQRLSEFIARAAINPLVI